MTNRRQFIRSGIALSAGFAAGSALSASGRERSRGMYARLPLQRFVFDGRFVEGVETARHAVLSGATATEISGDLTDLWFRHLDREWRHQPAALAGVTTRGALFVLATLAADRDMRVVYRGDHEPPRDGRGLHVLVGPAAVLSHATKTPEAVLWGAALGTAIAECPIGRKAAVSATLVTSERRSATAQAEPLVSWIIAPRSLGAPI